MTRSSDAHDALLKELEERPSPCAGDSRFIADHITDDDNLELAKLCGACPVFDLCHRYATVARVKTGYWAGKPHRTYGPRKGGS